MCDCPLMFHSTAPDLGCAALAFDELLELVK
jgi:hypothetical protein